MDASVNLPFDLGSLYRLTSVIGGGAAGVVFRGVNKDTSAPIAAKILHKEHTSDPEILIRFVQEKAILASLNHSSIVDIYDFVVEGDRLAIVTELVDGFSLRELLNDNGTLSPHLAGLIVSHVLAGLEYAHNAGILHRDVKPDNILLTRSCQTGAPGSVKLADFGISELVSGVGDEFASVGTPEYMPPELWMHGAYSSAGDVYEAGIVLYELLAGRSPFSGELVGRHHVEASVPRLDVPESLWGLLSRMLAKDPQERPSVQQARVQLLGLLDELVDLPALEVGAGRKDTIPITVLKTRSGIGAANVEERAVSVPASPFIGNLPSSKGETRLSPVSRDALNVSADSKDGADSDSGIFTGKKKIVALLIGLCIGLCVIGVVGAKWLFGGGPEESGGDSKDFDGGASIVISGDNTVEVGESIQLAVSVDSVDNSADLVEWVSSDKSIAVVNDKGKVTGKKSGEVAITATAKKGVGKSKPFKITVSEQGDINELAAQNVGVISDGIYMLAMSQNQDLVVEIPGGVSDEDTNAQVSHANTNTWQKFRIFHDDQGYVFIESVVSGRVLGVAGTKAKAGLGVHQYAYDNARNLKWVAVKGSTGIQLVSALSTDGNLYGLDIVGGNAVNGAGLKLEKISDSGTQIWTFSATKLITPGVYQIQSYVLADSSRSLDLPKATAATNASLSIFQSNESMAQRFYISSSDARGCVYIQALASGMYVGVNSSGDVIQIPDRSHASLWKVKPNKDYSWSFVNVSNNKVLEVSNNGTANGTNVQTGALNGSASGQKWALSSRVEHLGNGTYSIRPKSNWNSAIDIPHGYTDSGVNATLWAYDDAKDWQKWKVTDNGDGTYTLVSVRSGHALGLAGGSAVNGTRVIQETKENSASQRFIITWDPDMSAFKVAPKLNPNLVVSLANGSTKNGTDILISSDGKTSSQRFYFAQIFGQ